MNNIPTMLSRDDFQAQHKDMLVSACCEPLSKEEIEARRKPKFSVKGLTEYAPGFVMIDAVSEAIHKTPLEISDEEYKKAAQTFRAMADNAFKIASPLCIRFPPDYTKLDGSI